MQIKITKEEFTFNDLHILKNIHFISCTLFHKLFKLTYQIWLTIF